MRNMLNDSKDMAFVKTLSVLAKEFGIQTIAEYIESEELLAAACYLGIDFAQGYHTGKPTPEFIMTDNALNCIASPSDHEDDNTGDQAVVTLIEPIQ